MWLLCCYTSIFTLISFADMLYFKWLSFFKKTDMKNMLRHNQCEIDINNSITLFSGAEFPYDLEG
jgi:hypothetical protein